ncbi:putative phage abortive infection protein [Pantoea agglomerans]|jgi:hypothetical protein|uniref:putative phage abortive infection protein n=1 Tax=Enterobacter agglomerans TaxID=549 RepID=UPI00177C3E45|nr:putative phage abortive infection protein [Pantoea agglomerans]MBD8252503.1 putative phage abortive infection protein [Pantoea agglomerans]
MQNDSANANNSNDRKKISPAMKIAIYSGGLASLCIFAYAVFLIVVTSPIDQMTISNAGVFGDSFGVLTSLFSALAFGGVAVTIAMQKDIFDIQKLEMEAQKTELAINRKEMRKQGFENTFFQMIKLHNQILGEISMPQTVPGGGAYTLDGRLVFDKMKKSFEDTYFSKHGIYAESSSEDLSFAFQDFYKKNGFQLGHYFRFLYNILRFLSESDIDDKKTYSRLFRAQLSNQELSIIYYNALTPVGSKIIPNMQKFKLMDNLDPATLRYAEHTRFIVDVGFPPY